MAAATLTIVEDYFDDQRTIGEDGPTDATR